MQKGMARPMDWLTFFSKLVEALAWPIALLVVVMMFRERLREMIPFLKKLSFPGGVAAEFESKLEKLERAEDVAAGDGSRRKIELPLDETALRVNPTGVVMEKWKDVETAARALLSRNGGNRLVALMVNSVELQKQLARQGHINAEQTAWFSELRTLRNMAAHSRVAISEEQVARYVALADQLIGSIAETIFNTDPGNSPDPQKAQ